MLVSFVRFFRGYVDFTARGKFPERFLNLTSRRGINLWNTCPVEGGLKASMSVFDYRKIRAVARKSRVRLSIDEKHGLPFLINRYKGRSGLAIGAAVGIILMLVLSNFVWSISITGTNRVSDERLRQTLHDNGVYIGAYKGALDVQSIERSTALTLSDISWMSVNLKGSIASVEIKEKAIKPKLSEDTSPCNIKAKSDGVITNIKASKGEIKVMRGSGVVKGDLLVSGITETQMETVEYVRASAEVYADVIGKKEWTLPDNYIYYSLSENKIERYRLGFLWLEAPCSISFQGFDSNVTTVNSESLYINNAVLPLSLKTQTESELIKTEVKPDKKTAEKYFENEMLLYEIFDKGKSGVVSRTAKIENKDGEYICHTDYVFNENIAESVNFTFSGENTDNQGEIDS